MRIPASYTKGGKNFDTSFSRGSFNSWKETRAAAEHAVQVHVKGAEPVKTEAPNKKVKKQYAKKRTRRRRRLSERPRNTNIDTRAAEEEGNLPNIQQDATVVSATDEWWERGTLSREDRKRKRDGGRNKQPILTRKMERDRRQVTKTNDRRKRREGGVVVGRPTIPFGQDEGDQEEASGDHDEMLRLLANQSGVEDEYQGELEREWAARQDDKSTDNDIQQSSPLLWQLPTEWWDRNPVLRKTRGGHPWCQPPGLYTGDGPKGARIARIFGQAYMRGHADAGRSERKWTPAIDDDDDDEVQSDSEDHKASEAPHRPSGETRTKRGFGMNISNTGRKYWYGGASGDRHQ